jgi:hypothetical protein
VDQAGVQEQEAFHSLAVSRADGVEEVGGH